MLKLKNLLLITLLALFGSIPLASATVYMSQQEFLDQAFDSDSAPQRKTLWLNDELQQKINQILDHRYPKLRLKYWQMENQTVWFLDEIGKERPISFGISVRADKIERIEVLEFRESRGWEISGAGYAEQFTDAGLNTKGKLDRNIDGITGATMSVTAMKKVSRMALMLAKLVSQ